MSSLAPLEADAEATFPLLTIPREELLQIEKALTREWLETNGLGGYASSTVLFCATRRYHGLLVHPFGSVQDRFLFLSRFEESVHGGDKGFDLSMARYPGLYHPHGYRSIVDFALVPWPRATYRIGGTSLVKEVLLVRRRPIVLVRWSVRTRRDDLELRFRPLLPFRRVEELTFENLDLDPRVRRGPRCIAFKPYAPLPSLHLSWNLERMRFEADPVWYRRIEYEADLERGYDGREDQFNPGVLHAPVRDGDVLVLAASLDGPVAEPEVLFAEEAAARRARLPQNRAPTATERLELAADAFLYEGDGGRPGVIAGFPWFTEWGRDTFIALPGLTLARGDLETCRRVLEGALPYLRKGLMPNIFGRRPEESHYGSADASLWFARAVRLYELALPQDAGFAAVVDGFLPALEEIAGWYRDGTDLGIHTDDEGMVHVGDEHTNATWMDAAVGGEPVTPRHGCPIEIVALWYHLLAYLERLHERRGDRRRAERWRRLRRRLRRSMIERFWIEDGRYLGDCWRDGVLDERVRPNMAIAAALEFSPLTRGKRTDVLGRCEVELLTPYGLRTLSPKDPDYEGRYRGGPEERDRAYHQGTVWPWLLGFWIEGVLRVSPQRVRLRRRIRRLLDGFTDVLDRQGLNQVSEIFDGDPPHKPGGAIAQAWSVGELLRARRLLEASAP